MYVLKYFINKPEGCKQLAMSLLHNLYLNYVDYIARN